MSTVHETPLQIRPLTIIVLAGIILSISMALRQSMGLFLPPIRAQLAVSASQFGLAMAIQNIVWGLGQPLVGMLGDRYGARPVLIASALCYAAGLLIMSSSHTAWGLSIGGGVIVGLGIAGTGFGVLIGTVARAVPAQQRSQMVGVVSAAGSLGTLAVAPLGQQLMASFGWRWALVVFAAIAAIMGVVALGVGRESATSSPRADAEQPPLTVAQALQAAAQHGGYVTMTVAFFACGLQLAFLTAYLPQYLSICGASPATSATALGLIGLGNAIGSYAFGRLGARFSPKRLLSLIYLLRTAAIAAFVSLPVTAMSIYAFASVMGLLWLGVVPLVSSLIGRLFGLRHFNTLFGLAFMSHQVGSFVGAWAGGLSFDLTGSFRVAWGAMMLIGLTAGAIQWFMDDHARALPWPLQQKPA